MMTGRKKKKKIILLSYSELLSQFTMEREERHAVLHELHGLLGECQEQYSLRLHLMTLCLERLPSANRLGQPRP